ncbi:MAG: DUF1592 domain-containing protein [Akkermansiaceae bacterium]|nr:DUF1592 domain-containing protein [Akkermansiaceae bacterium]
MIATRIICKFLAIFVLGASFVGADSSSREIVGDFLHNYCFDCHDSASEKGEREFESLKIPLASIQDLVAAREIIDQITLKEMPPRKKDQPSDEERLEVLGVLRSEVEAARGRFASNGGKTVMRRLSNREYENTLEVLFGRRVDTLGLTADFPKEKTSRHIDTIGESLVTSGFLLDQYFQAAHRLVENRLGKPDMKARDWHFTDNFKQYEELAGSHRAVFKNKFLCVYEQPDTDTRQGSYGHIEDFLEGVPVSGLYDLKVLVQGMHRDTHYDPSIFGIDLSEPFILGVVPGDVTKGHIHYPQRVEPLLASSLVPDDKPEWINFRVWLEKGQTPRFIFPNGPSESRRSVIELNKRYKEEFKNPSNGVSRSSLLREGKLPHIRISEVKVHGPIEEKQGGPEEVAVFGKDGFKAGKALEQLERFAERAFRRPLSEIDRKRIHRFYRERIEEKSGARQAALDTLKLILCSPSFFYLSEITPEDDPALQPYDLASRLSYTLWAGPPDQELLGLAASGELVSEEILRKQVRRLLEDERSGGFVNGFLDSWLNLRDLGGMPPPREKARRYYSENWPASMKGEVRHFFAHMLNENLPAGTLLDADFTFVDKYLAALYRLPEAKTLRLKDGFRKVRLGDKNRRGGILGMAAVLTVSANGVDTSPVTRGVFVSENILGVVPPPPPDEVPPIEPDVRGATTLRERLEKHRESKTCAECHRKIDPLGFGLETFDQLGRWRDHYPREGKKAPKLKVDASGEMPSGEEFESFRGLREVLVETRSDVFAKHLITTILTYASGRHMEAVDEFEIGDVQERARSKGNGLRTLVEEALVSEIFRSR